MLEASFRWAADQGRDRHRATVLALALSVCGCASLEYRAPDTGYQTRLGAVTVVAGESAPQLKFEGFARGKLAGAGAGAGGTFGACIGGVGGGGCGGSFCGAALVLLLAICGIAGLVGSVVGAATAPDIEQALDGEARLARALEVRKVQSAVRDAVADSASAAGVRLVTPPDAVVRQAAQAGDYRALAAHGATSVVETTLVEAGTSGAGINDPASLYMQVRVRVVDTATNVELLSTAYRYAGRRLTLAGWLENQALPLVSELDKGYRILGRHIYETSFELYPFPDRRARSAGGVLSTAFGLAPIYPPTRGTLSGDRWLGARFEWYAVEDLRPRFSWQAFPRAGDLAEAADTLARVSDVRYDLTIAAEENMAPAEVVYARSGLASPEHAIEVALEPGKRYFWTVRARFLLDGRSRVTEWSSTDYAAREKLTAPSPFSFRFRTP